MDPRSPDPAAPAAGTDRSPKEGSSRKTGQKAPEPGFFERLFSFLFTTDDPDKKKQKALQDLGKGLRKARPRYYNPAQGLAEPALARMFYEMYKGFAPARALLAGALQSAVLKAALVESALTPAQTEAKEALAEKAIEERARAADAAALLEQVKERARQFTQSFEVSTINEIDASYSRLAVLLDLIDFDYHFLLRKFDSALPETDFAYKPSFAAVTCSQVNGELKDFLEILSAVDPAMDWERLLDVLKTYRGVEIMPRDGMRKISQQLRDLQRSGILLSIVRHAGKDPYYKSLTRAHRDRIVEPYITRIKSQAEMAVQKIASGKRNEKLDELTRAVFGTASVSRLANYSEKTNTTFSKNMLGGFLHVATLNFLKAFLHDYFKKNVRQIADLLLIRGKWANKEPSQAMSEAYHQLLKISDTITVFDEALAEDGDLGRKMRNVMAKADRDRKAIPNLRALLREINEQAGDMLSQSVQHFVAIAKVLKMVYDDCAKPRPELVVNWRELRPPGDKDLRTLVASVYRKIYSFVQLIQSYR